MTPSTRAVEPASVPLTIYYHGKEILGWGPVSHFVHLAVRLTGGELQTTGDLKSSRLAAFPGYLRPASRKGGQGALFIARSPNEALRFLGLQQFRKPHAFRALWIIDSFRVEDLPSAKLMSQFDVVAYTQAFDRARYESLAGDKALLLPWGTDALGLGSYSPDREFDILRLGRQPAAWDDDSATNAACSLRGLRFHGRPPATEFSQMQRSLMHDWYGRSKFIIAHSNLVAPAPYTHATREYITARWTDALAAGATVAGVQPKSDLALIDWPGATLSFDEIELERNLEQLAEAVASWTPRMALVNHVAALERLDWRLRLKTLCDRLEITAPALEEELAELKGKASALRSEVTSHE